MRKHVVSNSLFGRRNKNRFDPGTGKIMCLKYIVYFVNFD